MGGRLYGAEAVEGGGVIGRNGLMETLDLTLSNQGFDPSIGLLAAAVVGSVVVVSVDMVCIQEPLLGTRRQTPKVRFRWSSG